MVLGVINTPCTNTSTPPLTLISLSLCINALETILYAYLLNMIISLKTTYLPRNVFYEKHFPSYPDKPMWTVVNTGPKFNQLDASKIVKQIWKSQHILRPFAQNWTHYRNIEIKFPIYFKETCYNNFHSYKIFQYSWLITEEVYLFFLFLSSSEELISAIEGQTPTSQRDDHKLQKIVPIKLTSL